MKAAPCPVNGKLDSQIASQQDCEQEERLHVLQNHRRLLTF